jgi:hypothetical protein
MMKFPTTVRRARRLSCFLALGTALVVISATAGPASDLAQLLSGQSYPLSMTLKEFGADWRRVTVRDGASASRNVGVNVSGSSEGSTSQNNNMFNLWSGGQACITRGQTVSAAGQTYLVAYLLPNKTLNLNILLQAMATKTPPEIQVLTPESSLRLSLLNVQAIVAIEDVRAFDLSWEITQSKEAAQKLLNLLKAGQAGQTAKPPEAKKAPEPEKK